MTRIDSHQHFWQLSRGDYTWLTAELECLYRDFLPNDIAPRLQNANVKQTVLVQAAATLAETEFMLKIAAETDFVAGVVGWIDMQSVDAVSQLTVFKQSPYFKGIRPMIQDISDPNWMLKTELEPVFNALIAHDLTFDALVTPVHLDALYTLLKRYPKLKVVIDHGAKPDIANNTSGADISGDEWFEMLALIASDTSAYCKLSGLVTEAGKDPSYEKLSAYMEHLLSCFGPERLMWGSDWPVVNMSASYQAWLGHVDTLVKPLAVNEQESIWAGTARKFYRL